MKPAPSLRSRLRAQFLLLGVAPVLAVFAVAWALLVPVLVQQAETRNLELALAMRDQVRLQLDLRLRAAGVLADSLRADPALPALQRALDNLLLGDAFLQAALVADAQGHVVQAALSVQGRRFAADSVGLDLSGRSHVAAARAGGEPVWSDAYLSAQTGSVTAALVVPAGERTLLLELSLAALSQSVVDIARPGATEVVIVDRAGRVIAHPDARQALQQENLSDLPLVQAALAGQGGSARLRRDGVEQLAHALPVAPTGWVVLVSQPLATVMSPLLRLGGALLLVLAATVLLAVFVGWRLARRTGVEVARLADGAQQAVREGASPPELQFSSAEFNAVWTRLRDLFQQLRLRDEQTRAARGDLQAVLDAATQVAVVATDCDGRVTVFNIGAQRLLGWRESEVLGQLTPLAWHDEAELAARAQLLSRQHGLNITGVEALFVEARRSGYEVRDWRYRRRDGSWLDVSLAVTAMRTPDGALKGFLAVAVDITERRRAAELELARKTAELANQAKSDFLSQMSHELRTPLNAVLGYAQLLEADPTQPLAPRQRDSVQHIQRAGWHLVRLIDDVLDLARIESGRLKVSIAPVDTARLLAQVAQLVAPQMQQHGVTLTVDMGAAVAAAAAAPWVAADETRLVQVLVNLLGNAAKYNRPQGTVHLSCRAEGGLVQLAVADSGLGMTAAQLAQLYEPFNRLGHETSGIQGTGIGLVITRHLVTLMRGRIEVRSEPGVGTTFVVTLPVAGQVAAPAWQRLDSAPVLPPARGKVLYVEDNEVNAQLMRAILRQRPDVGLTVRGLVASGLEAARSEPPDLLLLDMHLPDGSGEDLLDALQADARLAAIPVVVVSADATRAHIDTMQRRGVRAYLTKPLQVAETLRVIDELLVLPAAGGDAAANATTDAAVEDPALRPR